MAQQNINSVAWYPAPPFESVGAVAPAFSTTALLIDGTDEGAAFCVQVPIAGNIRKIMWATRAVAVSSTLDVRVESISATTGFPSGSLLAANNNGAQVGLTANTPYLTTLTADAAVTRGQFICIVIKQPTASFGDCQIAATSSGSSARYPFCALGTPVGTWAKASCMPVLGLEYDTGAYYEINSCLPAADTITATTMGTGSTPDVVALRFQVATPQTFSDVWFWVDADGDFAVRLVSDAYHQANQTGILSNLVVDKDFDATTGINLVRLRMPAYVLAAATWYRLIIEPTSATTLIVYDFNLPSLASMDAWGGANMHLSTAKDPTADGSWTNYNSGTFRKPFMGIGLTAFADDVVAGGRPEFRGSNL